MSSLLDEVNSFLKGLRREFPDLFAPPPPTPGRRREAGGEAAQRERAREVIEGRIVQYAPLIGVSPRRFFIKDQRSLWGSCSKSGNLNFNWRLVLAPLEVLDYVVIHELCHMLEMNHSWRFWRRVERFCPEQKARRRWLRENECFLRGCDGAEDAPNLYHDASVS